MTEEKKYCFHTSITYDYSNEKAVNAAVDNLLVAKLGDPEHLRDVRGPPSNMTLDIVLELEGESHLLYGAGGASTETAEYKALRENFGKATSMQMTGLECMDLLNRKFMNCKLL